MSIIVRHLALGICLVAAIGCGKKKLQNFALRLDESSTLVLGNTVLEIYRSVNTNSACPSEAYTVMLGEPGTFPGAYTRLDVTFVGEPPLNQNIQLTERPQMNGTAMSVGLKGFYIALDAIPIANMSMLADKGPKVTKSSVTFLSFGKNNGDSSELQFSVELETGEQASGVISGPLTVEISDQCNMLY